MSAFGDWLNNNQGILAVILIFVPLIISYTVSLMKNSFSKHKNKSKTTTAKPTMKGLINASRDVKVSGDVIGEQHNVTNNTYNYPPQPLGTNEKPNDIIEAVEHQKTDEGQSKNSGMDDNNNSTGQYIYYYPSGLVNFWDKRF